jgi:curved DNA-binding protein CbpA
LATHYDNLQVSPKASEAVIKASYRVLVQKYHPDRFEPREEAERVTRILNAAWCVLGNPLTRAAYDRTLSIQEIAHQPITPPPVRKDRGRKARRSPYNTPEIDRIVNYMVDEQDSLNEKVVERFKALMLMRRIELGLNAIMDDAEETRFLQSIKDRMGLEQGMAFAELCAFIDAQTGQCSQPVKRSAKAWPHPVAQASSQAGSISSSPAVAPTRPSVTAVVLFTILATIALIGLSQLDK